MAPRRDLIGPMGVWRLIIDGPADGAYNMAVDRAMLEAHEAGSAPPTLRLYRWSSPTVSLGRFQPVDDLDRGACERYGVDLCRRPTGGRGVLHDDELTYSVVAGLGEGVPRGVSASYRHLCGALVAAYRSLGIAADLTARSRGERGAGACYLHATHADVSVGVAKLSGSAQVWHRDSCLQHGSFVISRDVDRESAVFGLKPSERAALESDTRTIRGLLGGSPGADSLERAVIDGFRNALGISFERGVLTREEHNAVDAGTDTFSL